MRRAHGFGGRVASALFVEIVLGQPHLHAHRADDRRGVRGIGYRGLVSIDHHYLHPPGITLAVSVSIGEAGAFSELGSARINDGLRAGRHWLPFEVDLSDYGGQRVVLRLEARARNLRAEDLLTWWGSPRIALRPPRTQSH